MNLRHQGNEKKNVSKNSFIFNRLSKGGSWRKMASKKIISNHI